MIFLLLVDLLLNLYIANAAPLLPPSVSETQSVSSELTPAIGDDTGGIAGSPDATAELDDERGILAGEEAGPSNLLDGGAKPKRPVDIMRADHPDCPMSCLQGMHGDGWCNSECAIPECGNDAGDCDGFCAPDCKDVWIGDGWCDKECFRPECNYDGGDCDRTFQQGDMIFPPPDPEAFDYGQCGCERRFVHNGKCDPECNNIECNWDGGDCRHYCAPGCLSAWLGDGECDSLCANEACGFDKGDCKDCSEGCRPDMIGNGICDGSCMNDACSWDMGDCAGVCKVYPVDYEELPFQYNLCRNEWAGDGACDCLCLNNDCHNDYNDCAGQEEACREIISAAEQRYGYSWPLGPVKKRPPPTAQNNVVAAPTVAAPAIATPLAAGATNSAASASPAIGAAAVATPQTTVSNSPRIGPVNAELVGTINSVASAPGSFLVEGTATLN